MNTARWGFAHVNDEGSSASAASGARMVESSAPADSASNSGSSEKVGRLLDALA